MDGEETLQCRICGSELANPERNAISCMRCNAAFHRDCWIFNGQCGIYGCGSRAYVKYRVTQEANELVSITEDTRAPIMVQPYVEALMRTLPRWGRRAIPACTLGLSGSGLVILLYFGLTGMPFSGTLTGIFLGMGLIYSLITVPLAGTLRRHPVRVAQISSILATILYFFSRSYDGTSRALIVASAVTMAMILSNAIVERFTAPYRLLPRPGPWVQAVIRSALTGVMLFFFLVLLTTLLGPHPVSSFIGEIACVSVLGFFVAAPPLELSKSALLKHMESRTED